MAEDVDLADALSRLAACGCDETLVEIVQTCLRENPHERFVDAGAVATEVAGFLAQSRRREQEALQKASAARAAKLRALAALSTLGLLAVILVWILVLESSRRAQTELTSIPYRIDQLRAAVGGLLPPWPDKNARLQSWMSHRAPRRRGSREARGVADLRLGSVRRLPGRRPGGPEQSDVPRTDDPRVPRRHDSTDGDRVGLGPSHKTLDQRARELRGDLGGSARGHPEGLRTRRRAVLGRAVGDSRAVGPGADRAQSEVQSFGSSTTSVRHVSIPRRLLRSGCPCCRGMGVSVFVDHTASSSC